LSKENEVLVEKLQQQDSIRQRLNEHIMYLQNEIKMRDELLESSDMDDDDSIVSSEEDEMN